MIFVLIWCGCNKDGCRGGRAVLFSIIFLHTLFCWQNVLYLLSAENFFLDCLFVRHLSIFCGQKCLADIARIVSNYKSYGATENRTRAASDEDDDGQ